ncbi:MAG: hypothetical protein JNK64_08375 [Myxococcales bacterium]|nr:hypothetical protein [Myxococcales bacterium]
MSCPSEARLAAAVAGEDPAAAAHAAGCPRCAPIVADGRAIRAALAALPSPSPRRRAEVLAEVLAEVERDAAGTRTATPRGRWRVALAAIVVAAMVTGAAAGVGAVRQRVSARRSMAAEVLTPATTASRPARRVGVAPRATAIATAAPAVIAPPAMEAAPIAPSPIAPPVMEAAPIAPSPIAPPAIAPPAGGAAIDGRRRIASSTASPLREPAPRAVETVDEPAAPPAPPPIGVAAFRAGWEALRAGQPLVARAHFDRAGDPAVAEDAAYWAAVASERAGDRLEAARRFRQFAQAFPASPRAADARAAAARLYDQ